MQTILEGVKHTYGKLVYTHKTHEKEATKHTNISFKVNILNIVLLSSVIIVGVIQLITPKLYYNIISGCISFIALLIGVYMYAYNHEKKSELNKVTAKKLLYLREKYMYFINDIENGVYTNESDIILYRDKLWEELAKVYELAPQTSKKSYKLAKQALQNNQEHTFVEGEVNNLL